MYWPLFLLLTLGVYTLSVSFTEPTSRWILYLELWAINLPEMNNVTYMMKDDKLDKSLTITNSTPTSDSTIEKDIYVEKAMNKIHT